MNVNLVYFEINCCFKVLGTDKTIELQIMLVSHKYYGKKVRLIFYWFIYNNLFSY